MQHSTCIRTLVSHMRWTIGQIAPVLFVHVPFLFLSSCEPHTLCSIPCIAYRLTSHKVRSWCANCARERPAPYRLRALSPPPCRAVTMLRHACCHRAPPPTTSGQLFRSSSEERGALTPAAIVDYLDRFIVGQVRQQLGATKRSRWRSEQARGIATAPLTEQAWACVYMLCTERMGTERNTAHAVHGLTEALRRHVCISEQAVCWVAKEQAQKSGSSQP
eukprot:1161890-Pelagomonas_calceolata.AAC.4